MCVIVCVLVCVCVLCVCVCVCVCAQCMCIVTHFLGWVIGTGRVLDTSETVHSVNLLCLMHVMWRRPRWKTTVVMLLLWLTFHLIVCVFISYWGFLLDCLCFISKLICCTVLVTSWSKCWLRYFPMGKKEGKTMHIYDKCDPLTTTSQYKYWLRRTEKYFLPCLDQVSQTDASNLLSLDWLLALGANNLATDSIFCALFPMGIKRTNGQ